MVYIQLNIQLEAMPGINIVDHVTVLIGVSILSLTGLAGLAVTRHYESGSHIRSVAMNAACFFLHSLRYPSDLSRAFT
jgi:hypothetical protein